MRARVYEVKLGGFTSGKTVYLLAMSLMRVVNACIDKYHLRQGFLKPHDMRSVNELSAITVYDDKKHCYIKEVTDAEVLEKLTKKNKIVPIEDFI